MVDMFFGKRLEDTGDDDPLHRMRQSEALLDELYGRKQQQQQGEVAEPSIRKVRATSALLGASVVSLALFVTVLFYKVNHFIILRENVSAKTTNLEAATGRRGNLFGNIVKLTLNHAALEDAIFSHTADARNESAKTGKMPEAMAAALAKPPAGAGAGAGKPDWSGILSALGGGGEVPLGRLLATVEQYPTIKSAETYKQAILSLIEMEDRIADRRMELTEALQGYNAEVNSYPWRYFAWATGFREIRYDATGTAKLFAPEINPEMYQQLVPFVKAGEAPK